MTYSPARPQRRLRGLAATASELRRYERRRASAAAIIAWDSIPQRALTTDHCAPAAKVSDTESPVSLKSAIPGVRHQLGPLGQCSRMAPDEPPNLVAGEAGTRFVSEALRRRLPECLPTVRPTR
jgi:hypothetical protein